MVVPNLYMPFAIIRGISLSYVIELRCFTHCFAYDVDIGAIVHDDISYIIIVYLQSNYLRESMIGVSMIVKVAETMWYL